MQHRPSPSSCRHSIYRQSCLRLIDSTVPRQTVLLLLLLLGLHRLACSARACRTHVRRAPPPVLLPFGPVSLAPSQAPRTTGPCGAIAAHHRRHTAPSIPATTTRCPGRVAGYLLQSRPNSAQPMSCPSHPIPPRGRRPCRATACLSLRPQHPIAPARQMPPAGGELGGQTPMAIDSPGWTSPVRPTYYVPSQSGRSVVVVLPVTSSQLRRALSAAGFRFERRHLHRTSHCTRIAHAAQSTRNTARHKSARAGVGGSRKPI